MGLVGPWALPSKMSQRVGSVLSPPEPRGSLGQTAGKSEGPEAFPSVGGGLSPALSSDGCPILYVLVSVVTARGRRWLHRLGGFSGPFASLKS